MKIYTLTLNPAFDLHYTIEDFKPYAENYVDKSLTQSAGKGINISRALKNDVIDNTAFVIVGNNDFKSYSQNLDVECRYFVTEGDVRKNITVHTKGMPETRISLDDFVVKSEVFDKFSDELCNVCDNDTIVTFTGRLPKGIDKQDAKDMLVKIKKTGAKIVCDCNSFDFEDLAEIKPWLIKPNETEIQQLCDCDIMEAGEKLYGCGVENVMISLGDKGVVFYCDKGNFNVVPPEVEVVSTIGAGDSTIAGFITAYTRGMSIETCVKYAVATGTAACLEEGTTPPDKTNVDYIFNKIRERI